jgi:hypothetical protein
LLIAVPALLLSSVAVGFSGTAAHAASTPTISVGTTTTVMASHAYTITGKNFTPNNYVALDWRFPDNWLANRFVQTDATGSFSATYVAGAIHGTGTVKVTAFDYGTKVTTAPASFTVTPYVHPVLVNVTGAFTVGQASLLDVHHLPADLTNTWVEVDLVSSTGTTTASLLYVNTAGRVHQYFSVPANITCGAATLTIYTTDTAHTLLFSAPVTVGC